MRSEAVAGNMAADLLEAGSEGQGDEVVGVLEVDLELIRVGDLNGDTVLHLLASGGYVESLLQVLRFMLGKDPKVLKEVAKQGNANGDTPLHLAIKNGHKRIANILGKLEEESFFMENNDGKNPCVLADQIWGWGYYDLLSNKNEKEIQDDMMLLDEICNKLNRIKNNEVLSRQNKNKDTLGGVYYEHLLNALSNRSSDFDKFRTSFSDIDIERKFMETVESSICEEKILEMLEIDPNRIQYKNLRGETILHVLAYSGNFDVLTKLVAHLVTTSRMTGSDDRSKLPSLSLLLEGDENGSTPLHRTIYNGNMKMSRYLIEVAPAAAYRVNTQGESPLYVAVKRGYDELVKYVLQVMPEDSMSLATRSSLLTPNKASLPHAAIRFKNLNMLKMILESIPSLINSLDEKGWKPPSHMRHTKVTSMKLTTCLTNFQNQ